MALTVRLAARSPIPLRVDFRVECGELLAITGPSGAGKSSILRSIAGLHTPTEALVAVGDSVWSDTSRRIHLPVYRRRLGKIFQSYALFPHMTALQNVATALCRMRRAERNRRALRWLAAVNLDHCADSLPGALSGGQRQRVALARALAREPAVLLLDEPFSASDPTTREQLYRAIGELRRSLTIPVVLVTHDLDEAQLLADRLLVVDRGHAVHSGRVAELIAAADTRALFDDAEAGGLLRAVIEGQEADGLTRLRCDAGVLLMPRLTAALGTQLRLRVHAQDIILSRQRPEGLSALNVLPARVGQIYGTGDTAVLVELQMGEDRLLARITRRSMATLGIVTGAECYAIIKSLASTRATIITNIPANADGRKT